MMTVRQIERLWTAKSYDKLLDELLCHRSEGAFRERLGSSPAITAAAMGMIRLDELNQTHSPIFRVFLHTILAAQEQDGGWGDLIASAWCLHALALDHGQGVVIERGLAYLAALQQAGGLWPAIPIRRMPADPFISAFILFQLGETPAFRQRVHYDDAVSWFVTHGREVQPASLAGRVACELDEESRAMWRLARLGCRRPSGVVAASGSTLDMPTAHDFPIFDKNSRRMTSLLGCDH